MQKEAGREKLKEAILTAIDKNAKLSAKDLSVMLGYEEEEVAAAVAEMEADSVICGYPTLIDWDKTDRERVTALIEVKVTPQRGQGFDRIAARIYKFDEVESVYLMSGGFDLTVIIDGKSMREVANFVSGKLAPMEAVLSTATHFVLKKYKEHGITLVGEVEDERMLITP
ncbi:MAG: Lrp/AsnC ligand binding domain-containing protein [Lachnospiraceae bacterium]|nr:Lrp/AsnC ligand binding domain-containing protein [Lachnospiraceae bacterium]